jgi:predicted nucleic acid-binding protein
MLEAGRLLVTTDFVVDETLTLIRCRLGLAAANTWWQQIDGSARVRWERVENDRFERARNLFFQYRDKGLSFTDCTSFAVMRELRPTTVITTDGHFRQAGFDVLPATRPRRTRKPPRS